MRSVLTLVTFLVLSFFQFSQAQTPQQLSPNEMAAKREFTKTLSNSTQKPLKQESTEVTHPLSAVNTQPRVYSPQLVDREDDKLNESKSAEFSKVALEAYKKSLGDKMVKSSSANLRSSTITKKETEVKEAAVAQSNNELRDIENLPIQDVLEIKEQLHQRNIEWQKRNLSNANAGLKPAKLETQSRILSKEETTSRLSAPKKGHLEKTFEQEIEVRRLQLQEYQELKRSQQMQNALKQTSSNRTTKITSSSGAERQTYLAPASRFTGSPLAEVPAGSIYDTLDVNGFPSIIIVDGGNGIGTNTFTTDYVYYLQGLCFVNEGQTLTINPGAVIKGMSGQNEPTMLIVAVGGTLVANGTALNPIIFTSEADFILPPASNFNLKANLDEFTTGTWGGVAILGDGPVNNSIFEIGILGDGLLPVDARLEYGGESILGNLGTELSYTSIRHTGEFNGVSGFGAQNSLTFGAVSNEAIVHHVEAIGSAGEAFAFYGGNVDASHLIALNAGFIAYDTDLGYTGKLQFIFGQGVGDRFGDHSAGPIELQVDAGAYVYNATFIGDGEFGLNTGVSFYNNAGGYYYNSVFQDLGIGANIEWNDDYVSSSYNLFSSGSLTINDNVFWNVSGGNYWSVSDNSSVPNFTGDPFLDGNVSGNRYEDPMLGVDHVPTNSPSLGFVHTGDNFFQVTDYAGAFDPLASAPWYAEWSFIADLAAVTSSVEPIESAPIPPARNPADVIAVFSDDYINNIGSINLNPDWGQTSIQSLVDIGGSTTMKLENFNYQGIDFGVDVQNVSTLDYLHLDMWTNNASVVQVFLISPGPAETAYSLPINPGTWQSYDIPLSEFAGVDLTNIIQMKFDEAGVADAPTIYLDNIYMYGIPGAAAIVDIDTADYMALVAMRDALGGDLLFNWTDDISPSLWPNVSFDINGKVTGLFLDQQNLFGDIPVELSTLDQLDFLSIGGNDITSFPEGMGNLDQLTQLYAWGNQLSSLPSDMFGMASLFNIDVSGNNLSAGSFNGIEVLAGTMIGLNLSSNPLFDIPSGIFSLTGLEYLALDDVQIFDIPTDIQFLTNLRTIQIGFNNISSFPVEINALTKLEGLHAYANQITNLPDFNNMRSLREIRMWNNAVSADVASFFMLDSLEVLDMYNNQLFGTLDGISGMSNVRGIYLAVNEISGGIPSDLGSLTELIEFRIHENLLDGTLSAGLFELPNIQYIELQYNGLVGNFPETTGTSSLYGLNLSNNQLEALSSGIGNFPSLENLNMQENNLTGVLPAELANNTFLKFITLGFNNFSGGIPTEWASLDSLQELYLTANMLDQPLPTELSALISLRNIAIDQNQIPGDIPPSWSALINLENIYIYDNLLTGLPDWSNIDVIGDFYAYNNYLEFDDFEALIQVPIGVLGIEPQLPGSGTFEIQAAGSEFTIDATVGGSSNHYTWFLDGQQLDVADTSRLTISGFNRSKAGTYTCDITNDSVSQISPLTLFSGERTYWISAPVTASDSVALVAIYLATNGEEWNDAENWLTAPVAMWEGVILENSRVTLLELGNKNLNGPIPPAIGNLSELSWLSLYNNNLGYLSGELFGLQKLHYLDLDNTGLTKLPPAINQLTLLDTLWIGGNPYQGKIPKELFDLVNLRLLGMYNTEFSGSIPNEISKLTQLGYLHLGQNLKMTGGLPDGISALTEMRYLNLSNNFTSGLEKIATMTNLQSLYLYDSPLAEKTLPNELSSLVNIERLGLSYADYSEGIPDVIWNFTRMKVFQMPLCNVNGPLPAGLANMDSLTFFNIRDNGITGGFPAGFDISMMEQLYIHNNSIDDISIIANATSLQQAFIYGNRLDFEDLAVIIPLIDNGAYIDARSMQPTNGEYTYVQIAAGTSTMLTMNLTTDEFTVIDWFNGNGDYMGSGTSLVLDSSLVSNPEGDMEYEAYAYHSEISNYTGVPLYSGLFDVQVVEPVSVQDSLALIAFYNAITNHDNIILPWLEEGPVENWTGVVAHGGQVRGLYLYGLEGTIPAGTIGALESLEGLSIVDGGLTGPIPDDIFSPVMSFFDLGRNAFTGSIPSTIGSAQNLQFVGLAGNQLTGSIPDVDLPNLYELYLDDNGLTGAIPASMVNGNFGGFSVDRNDLDDIPAGLYAAFSSSFYVNFEYNNFDYFDLANGLGNFVGADYTNGVQSVTRSITFTGDPNIGGEVTLRAERLDPDDQFTWFKLNKYSGSYNPTYDYLTTTGSDSTLTFFVNEDYDQTNYLVSVTNPNYKNGSYEFLSHYVAVDPFAKRYVTSITATEDSGFRNGSVNGAIGFPDSPPNGWEWDQLDNHWYSQVEAAGQLDTAKLFFEDNPIPINYIRLYGPYELSINTMTLRGSGGEELIIPLYTNIYYFDNQFTFPKTTFAVTQIDLAVSGGAIDAFEIGDTGGTGLSVPFLSDRYTDIGPDVIYVDIQYKGVADYIILERSADGTNFITLDTVAFTGWYADQVTQNQFYYRAKAVYESFGVSSEYSEVLFTGNCEPTLPANKIWSGISSAPDNPFGGLDSQRDDIYITSPYYAYFEISDISAGWYDQFFGFFEENGEIRQRCHRLLGRGFSYISEFDATYENDTLRIDWYDNVNGISGFSKFWVTGDQPVEVADLVIPYATQAYLIGSNRVELNWQGQNEQYIVQRSKGTSTQYVNVDTVSTNSYFDANSLDNSYYYYRVLSYNGERVSLPSNESNLVHKAALFEPVANSITNDITRTSYGGSWGDFDGDGDDDLYVTNAFEQPANFLYENTGNGTFKKIIGSIATSEEAFTRSASWGDYDNDGFLDLLVPTRDVAGDRIYHNTGSKSFEIGAPEVTTATDNIPSESGIWVDLDNDGFLDIVNSNGMVFTNNGSGGFTLTQRLENQYGILAELPILIWTVSNVDIDNDRDQDLYFTADAYNMLFLNDGTGQMSYVENTISNISLRSRGFTWADFNNDGNIDLLTGDRSPDLFGLYLNDGNLGFDYYSPDDFVTESSIPASSYSVGRGYSAADFDNDGNIDIIGMLNSRARIFYNNGNAEFRLLEVENQAFPQTSQFSHVSLADFNGDGAIDIFLPNQEFTGANYMYRNNGNSNNWLTIQLKGIESNRTGIGARVRVKSNNKWQSQTVRSLNGISSGNSLALEFGLGASALADSVEVLWPSGLITSAEDVTSKKVLSMVEIPQASGPTVNQSDSTALLAIYNKNGGANWTRKQGWLTGSPLGWEGVNFNSAGRVISLILNDNNLTDTIASQITTLSALQVLDLSGNNLKGPLPIALGNLTALVNLSLYDNQLDGTIPSSVGSLINLENLDLYNNKFFGELPKDLGKLVKIKQLEIHNNGFIGFVPAEIGTLKTLAVLRLDNNDFEGPLPVGLGGMTNLQVLYVNDNHFTESLPSDLGSLSKLLEFKAQNNEFFGALPTSLSNLKELQYVDISNNQFTGSIAPLSLAPYLYYFNANKNRFTVLPDLSKSIADSLLVRNNSLDFGAFELNDRLIKNNKLFLSPQDSLFEKVDSLQQVGSEIEIFYPVGGSFNSYKWLFNGTELLATDAILISASSLILTSPDTPNQGEYVLEITNSNYPGITLRTNAFNLKLSSLERDKRALLAFAAAVNKGAFPVTLNWSESSELTSAWDGVTVADNRVTELVLPAVIDTDLSDGDQSQIFDGDVPLSFADLSGLVTLNLKDHFLRSFPNISNWPSIGAVNISNNRLAFKDIIPNVKLGSKITYIPQRRYDVTTYDTVQAGDDKIVRINMSGTGLAYQWYFGSYIPGQPFNNNVSVIEGANSRVYQIENVDYSKMGTYRVEITHPSVPGLTISSRNKNILAKTDVFGTVYADGSNTLLDDGEVILYRKTPTGPFVAEDTTSIDGGGEYAFTDVVLGDFLALVNPNRVAFPNTINTYYEKAEFFSDATTIVVRNRVEGIDIEMIFYEEPTIVPTGANFDGLLESDFADDGNQDEEGSGRIESRRKVKKAACSMRRFVRAGRTEEDIYELYAYVESDDEGRFNFEGIEEGKYRLNIEYPGIPMDPNAEIEFIVGGDKENQKFTLLATITENGIQVEAEEVLYSLKPYIKDIKLYPNPTEDVMRADFLVYRKLDNLRMEVLDVRGVKLFEEELDHRMGLHSTKVDLTSYNSGVYFMVFTDEAGTFRQQVKIGKK